MIGDRDTGGQEVPRDPREPMVLAVHELAEALTALGGYVAAASRLSDDGKVGEDVRKALAGALSQQERAVSRGASAVPASDSRLGGR